MLTACVLLCVGCSLIGLCVATGTFPPPLARTLPVLMVAGDYRRKERDTD